MHAETGSSLYAASSMAYRVGALPASPCKCVTLRCASRVVHSVSAGLLGIKTCRFVSYSKRPERLEGVLVVRGRIQ